MENLRQRLETIDSLPEAIDLFTTLRRLESQWVERLKQIDNWHKALRVYLADYNPGAPKAERNRVLDEIEKRIDSVTERLKKTHDQDVLDALKAERLKHQIDVDGFRAEIRSLEKTTEDAKQMW